MLSHKMPYENMPFTRWKPKLDAAEQFRQSLEADQDFCGQGRTLAPTSFELYYKDLEAFAARLDNVRWPAKLYGRLALACSVTSDGPTVFLCAVTGQNRRAGNAIYQVGTIRDHGQRARWQGLARRGTHFDFVDVLPKLPSWMYAALVRRYGLFVPQVIRTFGGRRLVLIREIVRQHHRCDARALADTFSQFWRRLPDAEGKGQWQRCEGSYWFIHKFASEAQSALVRGDEPDWNAIVMDCSVEANKRGERLAALMADSTDVLFEDVKAPGRKNKRRTAACGQARIVGPKQ